ncbi:MAG: efflux RND transporter periplasmic adaptor subunit [Verrucomicrobia bacterium]|nr:efflux RND transporter periplasmic adaptor subunit [Verrucomicrobiota bacterium]
MFEQKLLSRNDFETTAELAVGAANDVAEAKNRLNVLLAGSRPEEIEATQAELARLEAQRRYLEEQLRLVRVVSPASGVVTTPSRQLREMRFQLVKKGDLIAKVHDLRTITAQIVVSEKEIADVKVGQKVLVKARAYPDETFPGTVVSIATTAQTGSSSTPTGGGASGPVSVAPKSILVTTEIDNRSLRLKLEMTGQAKIFCGERRVVDLVTRRESYHQLPAARQFGRRDWHCHRFRFQFPERHLGGESSDPQQRQPSRFCVAGVGDYSCALHHPACFLP